MDVSKARAALDAAMGIAGLVLLVGHYLSQWQLEGEGLALGYGLVALVMPSFRTSRKAALMRVWITNRLLDGAERLARDPEARIAFTKARIRVWEALLVGARTKLEDAHAKGRRRKVRRWERKVLVRELRLRMLNDRLEDLRGAANGP